MKRFACILSFSLGMLLLFGTVVAQPGQDDYERLHELISQVAGDDFRGDPCELTEAQREEIDKLAEDEFGFSLGFADIPCDEMGGGDMGGGHGGNGGSGGMGDFDPQEFEQRFVEILHDVAGADFSGDPCDLTQEQLDEINRRLLEEFGEECPVQIGCMDDWDHDGDRGDEGDIDFDEDGLTAIILGIAGPDFNGDPCSLTQEQREEIDRKTEEELGVSLGFADIPCDMVGGEGGDHGGDIDPAELEERFLKILEEVAGADFSGDPCDLTQEQLDELNRRLAEEFGEECPIEIICDDEDSDGDRGSDGDIDFDGDRLTAIILEVAGQDFDGDPCSLTQEQREEIDRLTEEELGISLGFADIPCDMVGGEGEDHGDIEDFDPTELEERFLKILREVAGADFQGDPCDLTEEQRDELNRRLAEEFGEECPIVIECFDDWDHDGDRGEDGDIDFDDIDLDRLTGIILEVAGNNFSGNPCDLTQEQREEIDRLTEEELGISLGFSEIPCESAGGTRNEGAVEQARAVLQLASQKLSVDAVVQQSAYPNPVRDYTTIEFKGPEGYGRITVMNSRGELVIAQDVTASKGINSVQLDLRSVLPGPYYVKVTVEHMTSETLPIVVQ